jgi:hypothetical protein
VPCVLHMLRHILNTAEKGDDQGAFWALPAAPSPLPAPPLRGPIVAEGLLRWERLLDVHPPLLELVRPCIFKPFGWALGRLSAKEWLQAFNSPLSLDAALLVNTRVQELLRRSFSQATISAIFHIIWSDSQGGGRSRRTYINKSMERLPPQPIDIKDIKKDKDLEEDGREGAAGSTRSEFPRCKDTPLKMASSPAWNAGPLQAATQDAMLSLEEQDKLNANENGSSGSKGSTTWQKP